MRVKKYLKKQAQEDLRNLETEADREFLTYLQNSVVEEPPKKKRNLKWLWAIPASVAACTAIVLPIVLTPAGLDEVKYEDVNFVQVDSDQNALISATEGMTLRFTEDQSVIIKKTYDSVSGDDLYYSLRIEESSEQYLYKLETRIVVNDKYEFEDFRIDDSFETQTYPDYSVIYDQIIRTDSETGLNLVSCKAKIESAKYNIYVLNYEEYSPENGTFLGVIASLFDFSA